MNFLNILKAGFLVISVLISSLGFSQAETMRAFQNKVAIFKNDTVWTRSNQPTLMLVPFEPMMYKSSIDRSIGQTDGTTYKQIVGNFRTGLDNLLFIETDSKYRVIRMMADDEDRRKDLYTIYGKSGKDYRVLAVEPEEAPKKVNLPKLKKQKPQEAKPHGTRMQNGQIVSDNDGKERFMARTITDSSLFNYLHGKYGSVLYVFINQFDVGPMAGLDYRSFEGDEYQREIRVHYSVYTHEYEIYSGVAKTYFSSMVNSQKEIIIENMPDLARQISANIPVMIAGEENK